MHMTPRDKLLANLRGSSASGNRVSSAPDSGPSLLCPGGMMSSAVTEVMSECNAPWPEAHVDPKAMVRLALAMQDATGFDNLAVPFCMTIEAECYGAKVNLGALAVQPRVRDTLLPSDGTGVLRTPDWHSGRAAVLIDSLRRLRALRPQSAIVGNLVGPFSLLGTLMDPMWMLRWARRRPDFVRGYLARVTSALVEFGRLQIRAGADVICIAEPTGTGEILGPALFALLVAPFLQELTDRLRSEGAAVIIHICGDARSIEDELSKLRVDAVSFDSVVDVVDLVKRAPPWRVMGNVSPFLLAGVSRPAIAEVCRGLLDGGVRLIAPGCGIIPTTPVANLKAMRAAV